MGQPHYSQDLTKRNKSLLINNITHKKYLLFSDPRLPIQTAANRSIRIRIIEKYPSIFERELITYHSDPTKAHAGLVRSRWYVFFITSVSLYFRERTGVPSRRKIAQASPCSTTPSILLKLYASVLWHCLLFALAPLHSLREAKTRTAAHQRETTTRTMPSITLQSVRSQY